jgi:hypothetical protein
VIDRFEMILQRFAANPDPVLVITSPLVVSL